MDAVTSISTGLHPEIILSSIIYTFLGIILMLVSLWIFDQAFKLNIKKELFKEHNSAFGIVLAGASIAIAIIVSAAIN